MSPMLALLGLFVGVLVGLTGVGAITHWRQGTLSWRVVGWLAAGGRLSQQPARCAYLPEHWLRPALASVLLFASMRLL